MPAVQLSKLTAQIELLLPLWEQPDLFLAQLTDLLEYHADHLYQAADQVLTTPTLPIYRVPAIILRTLERALIHQTLNSPEAGSQLAEILWRHGYAETHQLAAAMMGSLPPPFHPAVIEQISSWKGLDLPSSHVAELIEMATRQIRSTSLPAWLAALETWLDSNDPNSRLLALQALLSLIQDERFENLPFIFRLIRPLIQSPPDPVVPDLASILHHLAIRSPGEATFFFRQAISGSPSPKTLRLLRRSLPSLPDSARASLTPLLRDSEPPK